jgi:hypothetical protein
VTDVEDGVSMCRTKLFTVGKDMTLCNNKHNNIAVLNKTIITSKGSTVCQLRLPYQNWYLLTGEGWGRNYLSYENKCSAMIPSKDFRFTGHTVAISIPILNLVEISFAFKHNNIGSCTVINAPSFCLLG